MSLFKSKEWWRTECGSNGSFDKQSLLVCPLFGDEKKDAVVVGSHDGYLRVFMPTSTWLEETKNPTGFKSTDLLLETKVAECVVDLKSGRFASGSQEIRLAILTPKALTVYTCTFNQDSIEHGDRCVLSVTYEHALPRFPLSLTTGPFGGVRGRDFLCVQCLDGILLFFEQETFAFQQSLENRLLPSPVVYVARKDVFVTTNSSWMLECYRYQNIAEFGRSQSKLDKGSSRVLGPDWSYNLGEAILDINVVTLSSFEVGILVLGERNLFCLRDTCTLKYTKRLEYDALCFHAYVIEPDGKLMVMVVADTGTLMVYEGTTLRWSAQLTFPAVAITRAHFQNLEGAIVVLSEDGILEVCYLGSEPSLFVAPPIHRRTFEQGAVEEELFSLRKILRESASSGSPLAAAAAESELSLKVQASPELEPCPSDLFEEVEGRSMCRVSMELTSYTPLRDVQVHVDVSRPLVASKASHAIPTLCDRLVLETTIHVEGNAHPVTSEARVTVTYEVEDGGLRVLQKTLQLPLKLTLNSCIPETTASSTVTLKSKEPLLNFGQLFPEFTGERGARQNSGALGLQHLHAGSVVTILLGSKTNRYRVQSNESLALTSVVHQLTSRYLERFPGSLTSSVARTHLQVVQAQVEAHFAARREVQRVANEIALTTTQLRNVEKRMLRCFRERNSRSLAGGLATLLDSTYRSAFDLIQQLAEAQAERDRAGDGLRCALRLLLLLARLCVNDDKYNLLESAIGFVPQLHDDVGWEEIADVGLSVLLKATSRKQEHEVVGSWNKLEPVRDVGKLKKRIVHAVERLGKDANLTEFESADPPPEDPIRFSVASSMSSTSSTSSFASPEDGDGSRPV
ncbi:protein PTHB1 [Orussus abietinus]|uniref:protein PTHB1 n=1 Tax=Orussus abietinus TaxID=222816 RepID=UPI00062656F6|nr:protein PTHB1 [Orussus abietinus]